MTSLLSYRGRWQGSDQGRQQRPLEGTVGRLEGEAGEGGEKERLALYISLGGALQKSYHKL